MDAVDAFLARLLPPDPAPAARAAAAVAPNQGALLHVLARATGARRVLEVGTLAGYSAAWLLVALPHDGELVTLDVDPSAGAHLPGDARVRLVPGPALETLPTLEGPFDLVFLDGDKAQAAETLAAVLPLCRPGTLVIADNVVRGGAVADPDDPDPRVRGVRALVDAVAAEPRLVATALQTVGEKGHDGLLLALVVEEDAAMPSTTGGCLCGGVRFELTEPATAAGYCHCTRCQKRTGTSQSAQARIDARTFRLVAGEHLVKGWRHPDGGFEKCFCSECGSQLFSRSPDGSRMSVRLSAFDADPGVRPAWRAFVDYAAPWEPVPDDGLTRHPEARPR